MSSAPTSRSPDLQRLRDDGYDLSIVAGMLVVRDVPFVDMRLAVRRGTLAVPLVMSGDRTARPDRHGALWGGGTPCDRYGRPLANVIQSPLRHSLPSGIAISHQLCNRPFGREFVDYHELVTTYAALISGHAVAIDSTARIPAGAGTIDLEDAASPFRYTDTATARARLSELSGRFPSSVGIVGIGGTGSYVLDLVAKTPVRSIHLFDDDAFLQHNAFRSPGAASIEELDAQRAKVDHFASVYCRMHAGIVPHRRRLAPGCLDLLDRLDFVFLCIDDGPAKASIVDRLEQFGTAFIDVGMGVEMGPAGLFGTVRVTTSTPERREHVHDRQRIPMDAPNGPDLYASNIQVADLNMLNAAMAVIRWKRLIGFYADGGREHHSTYDIDGNHLNNADCSTSS